jgi:hypothetical protein
MRAVYRLLLNFCLALVMLGACFMAARAQGLPGSGFLGSTTDAAEGRGVQDMKLGSVLFFNYYTSDPNNTASVDTIFNLTNVHPTSDIALHLFFVDSTTCNVADAFFCLTRNQTASFRASDMDPGVVGYVIAVAVDSAGRPVSFNALAGEAMIGTGTGHRFLLPAVVAARRDGFFASPVNSDGQSATMFFNNAQYDLLPQTLVLDSFPSQVAGIGAPAANTVLYVYSPLPNLTTPDAFSGSLFFLVYDDQEQIFSGSMGLNCFLSSSKQRITSVRTTPNVNTIVPSGHTGWASFYGIGERTVVSNITGGTTTLSNFPLMGATATRFGNFNGGHNLRLATTFAGYSITIPLITPNCGTIDAGSVMAKESRL